MLDKNIVRLYLDNSHTHVGFIFVVTKYCHHPCRSNVKKEITNQYELAIALAIRHTIEEIATFYASAAGVMVASNPLQKVLKTGRCNSAKLCWNDVPTRSWRGDGFYGSHKMV